MKRLEKQEPEGGTTALTVPSGNFLARLGAVDTPAPTVTSGESVPYIAFYSGREGARGGKTTAADIVKALGGTVAPSTPYVCDGDVMVRLSGPVFLLDDFEFWCKQDSSNAITDVAVTDPGRGWKHSLLCLALVVEPEPRICLFDVRGAKTPAFAKIAKAIRDASGPDFVAKHGASYADVPERFRVAGEVRAWMQPSREGDFEYVTNDANVGPASVKALETAFAFVSGLAECKAFDYFESRRTELQKQAGVPF